MAQASIEKYFPRGLIFDESYFDVKIIDNLIYKFGRNPDDLVSCKFPDNLGNAFIDKQVSLHTAFVSRLNSAVNRYMTYASYENAPSDKLLKARFKKIKEACVNFFDVVGLIDNSGQRFLHADDMLPAIRDELEKHYEDNDSLQLNTLLSQLELLNRRCLIIVDSLGSERKAKSREDAFNYLLCTCEKIKKDYFRAGKMGDFIRACLLPLKANKIIKSVPTTETINKRLQRARKDKSQKKQK